jgi:hypothetical protein
MTEDRADYLESGSGDPPDRAHLDALRALFRHEAMWAEPPARVGDELLREVAASSEPRVIATRSPWLAVAVIVGALFVAVAAAAGGLFDEPSEIVIAMTGTDLEPSARGEVEIRSTGAGWWISLETDGLSAADEGTYYEGWMWSDQGAGVSIGTFHLRSDDEPVILWSGVDPDAYPSVWVTLEEEDGDPSASDRVVMRGRAGD